MSIELFTRTGGLVTSVADAITNKQSNVNGIMSGCEVTTNGSTVTIGAGWMMIEGRIVHISSSESISVSASGGTIALRLSPGASPYAQIVAYASGTALTMEDINNGGSVYEQQLGTFTLSAGTVTFNLTLGVARANLALNPQRSRADLGIFIQSAQPSSPGVGDLWLW